MRRGLVVSLVALLLGGFAAMPAAAAPEVTLNDVYQRLQVAEVPADYVVLVDTSGSMSTDNRYGQVKQILRTFLASLRDIDTVSVATFAGTTVQVQRGRDLDPDAVINRMPANANGDSTDIGAAIESALRYLRREGKTPSAAVVLLTDGKHSPPGNSAYVGTEGPAWAQLAGEAHSMNKVNLRGFSYALTQDVSGAELLRKVIPNTEVIALPTSELGRYLSQLPEELRQSLANVRLGPDLTKQIEVRWQPPAGELNLSAGELPVDITVKSTATYLPVDIVDPVVNAGRGAVTGLPTRISLEPGASKQIHATWHPNVQQDPGALRTGELQLHATVDTPWRKVIEEQLSTKVALPAVDSTADWSDLVISGLAWLVVLLTILLVVAVAAVLLVLWLREYPRMRGSMVVDPPDGPPVRVDLTGRRRIRLDKDRAARSLGTTGPCLVRGNRQTSATRQPTLVISYAPRDRKKVTGTCVAGSHRELYGLRFLYFADERGIPFVEDDEAVRIRP